MVAEAGAIEALDAEPLAMHNGNGDQPLLSPGRQRQDRMENILRIRAGVPARTAAPLLNPDPSFGASEGADIRLSLIHI